jgi:hypothetical protein
MIKTALLAPSVGCYRVADVIISESFAAPAIARSIGMSAWCAMLTHDTEV